MLERCKAAVRAVLGFKKRKIYIPKRIDGVKYEEHPKFDRFVFICGLHRSGTTLLERLMALSLSVSYLRADTPESEGQHMQTLYSPASRFGGPGRFAFSEEMNNELRSLSDSADCHERILGEWKRFVVGSSPVLLEKSPPNLTKIGWLRKTFKNSKFIIMARDPRAVSAATQKWSGTSLPELMIHWNTAYSKAIEDFRKEDCLIVRYEDLCEDVYRELKRVSDFIGLPLQNFSAAKESRFNEVVNQNGKYLERHTCKKYGAGIWEKFGYDV